MEVNLHILDWILIGATGALFLAQFYWYCRYMAAPARALRRRKKADSQNPESENPQPGVSVILCAHNESDNLSNYLQALLTQDYPTYEVIVVDDGSEDDTRAVIERYMARDERLHMTFVPFGARVGSTKKLALTLAAKSARYDYLLLTDADCVPESNRWISEMMKGFGDAERTKEIVLGFGAYFEEKGFVNRLVCYDTLFNGLHYLGAALCGHPYMGVGRNLAYRKALFFESGGFSHLMTNRAGDDDLFVNHVATRSNTAVVVTRDSYTWSPAKKSLRDWLQQKRRHVSVSPAYKPVTKFRLALEPMMRGLFYAAVIATIVWQVLEWGCPWTNFGLQWLPSMVTVGLFLLRWLIQTAVINTSARRMGLKRFGMLSVLWFDISLPLVNLWMLAIPSGGKKKW